MHCLLIILIQMYNLNETKQITKKRYFFKTGYLQLPLGAKAEAREDLIKALRIKGASYFSYILNHGIVDITIYKYELITAIFEKYGVVKNVWSTIDVPDDAKSHPYK